MTIAMLTGLLVASETLLVPAPAHAEECGPGEVPVPDPTTGEIVCRGGGGGDDGGDDDGGGDDGGGEPAPPDGTTREAEKVRECSEQDCPRDIWGCDFEGDEVVVEYARRTEVYRTGQGWVPVAGEEGQWEWYRQTCGELEEEQAPTEAEVWEAVNRFGLEGAQPSIEPPNGRSLVNIETNFYTDQTEVAPFDLPVGPVNVEIQADARSFTWNFGDGTTKTTDSPGHPYPNMDVTHVYEETGHFQPSVTISYTVQWRFGGGDWQTLSQPIESSASPEADLEILESAPVLGGGD